LSFNGNKLITAGGGGAIISAVEAGGREIKHLTTTARVGAAYDHDVVGFNYRMTNLQAAVGIAQFERLPEFLRAKARIAASYARSFKNLPGILPFPSVEDTSGSHWLSGIYLPDASNDEMAHLRSTLAENGIEARSFWKPIHMQEPYWNCPRLLNGVSEAIWDRVQPLPCSTHLADDEQAHVIEVVRSVFGQGA
jgi:dTDP-4-amino-4,6-dideoxygalactose transaminase